MAPELTFLVLLIPFGTIATFFLFRHPEVAFGLFAYAYVIKGGELLPDPFNLTAILLTIAATGFLLPVLVGKRKIRFRPESPDFWLWIFVIIVIVGSYIVPSPEGGFVKSLRFIAIVFVPYFLARIFLTDFVKIRNFLVTILISASAVAIFMIATWVLGYAKMHGGRVLLLEANPIPVATFFAAGTILAIGGVFGNLFGKKYRLFLAALIPILLFAMLLTGIRGQLIGLIVGLTFYLSIVLIKKPRLLGCTIALGIPAAFIAIINWNILYRILSENIPNFSAYTLTTIKMGMSTAHRLEQIGLVSELFLKHPIIGAGTGGFAYYTRWGYPHNIILEVLSESGLIGLMVLLGFLFAVAFKAFKIMLNLRYLDETHRSIGLVILTVAITLFIGRQFSYGLDGNKDLFIFLALITNYYVMVKYNLIKAEKNELQKTI